jgi:hypothetical protein
MLISDIHMVKKSGSPSGDFYFTGSDKSTSCS